MVGNTPCKMFWRKAKTGYGTLRPMTGAVALGSRKISFVLSVDEV